MKVLLLFSALAVTCFCVSLAFAREMREPALPDPVPIPLEMAIAKQRTAFMAYSHDHEKVIAQYDRFVQTLQKIYQAGEGMIQSDVQRILEAVVFAAEAHVQQARKDPQQTPYIIHPIGVAQILLTLGNVRDPDVIIGALLHDTVEDTQVTIELIEQKFGSRAAGFVREVTDDKALPKTRRKELQITHAPHKSAGAAQIKLADKLYNLTDLSRNPPLDWTPERICQYFDWAQRVVDQLPWVNASLKNAVDQLIANFYQTAQFEEVIVR